MEVTIFLGLTAAVALLVVFFLNQRKQKTGTNKPISSFQTNPKWQQQQLELDPHTRFIEHPKRRHYRLLNDSEQILYDRLREAMPNMQIFAQVGVAQLALLRGRHEAQRLSQMAGRGVDFVVCDQEFSIIAAIELSWPSSDGKTANNEVEKHQALESLGIPLIIFRPNELPNAETISREIAEAIIQRNRLEESRS